MPVKNAVCPFYCGEMDCTISSEGVVQGSNLVWRFAEHSDKVTQRTLFCYSDTGHRLCEVYRMLYENYDEG